MSPKSLLRHPDARSPLTDFDENSTFMRLIPECGAAADRCEKVKRLLFCSGKVYYDLVKERAGKDLDAEVAIARVEQVG